MCVYICRHTHAYTHMKRVGRKAEIRFDLATGGRKSVREEDGEAERKTPTKHTNQQNQNETKKK